MLRIETSPGQYFHNLTIERAVAIKMFDSDRESKVSFHSINVTEAERGTGMSQIDNFVGEESKLNCLIFTLGFNLLAKVIFEWDEKSLSHSTGGDNPYKEGVLYYKLCDSSGNPLDGDERSAKGLILEQLKKKRYYIVHKKVSWD